MPARPRTSRFALTCCAVATLAAANADAQFGAAPEVRLPEGVERVRVPFESMYSHTVIPVSIDGHAALPFVFDTGMPADGAFLYGGPAVDALALEFGPMRAQIGGAGGDGARVMADIATDQSLRIGDVEITGANLIVAPPMPAMGSHHDGIIGYTLFHRFVVHFDHDAGVVEFIEPSAFEAPEGAIELPISLLGHLPYVEVEVVNADGSRVPIKVVVDTGASHPISLNVGTADGLELPAGAVPSVLGRGLSGEIHGHAGRVAGIAFGDVVVRDVVATFPEEAFQNPRGIDSLNGNLGNALLERFQVWFDYSSKRLLLTPREAITAPFEWDMSGLYTRPEGDGVYVVADVADGSPAEEAGVRVDDHLLSLDGRTIDEVGHVALREALRSEGRKVTLGLERDGERFEVVLTLTRRV